MIIYVRDILVHHCHNNILLRVSTIFFTTGTDTAFPACLYRCEFAISFGNLKPFGNPWKLKHSLGVNFLPGSGPSSTGTLDQKIEKLKYLKRLILLYVRPSASRTNVEETVRSRTH